MNEFEKFNVITPLLERLAKNCQEVGYIDPALYDKY